MNYQETIQYIESLVPTLEGPSLTRIQAFLSAHGSPQDSFAVLHVGGTNGKGSTVAMLASILKAGGLKVGRYTGPHLLRWNERFHIDGKPIADDDFAERATRLRQQSEQFADQHPELGPLSWFEFLTALGFFFFAENQVDLAVVEVGLGGRFDATNVIAKPLVVGITNISIDHTHMLGHTVEQIAMEKAGIIKAEVPIVTAAQPPALEVIRRRATELNAPFVHCLTQSDIDPSCSSLERNDPWRDWIQEIFSQEGTTLVGAHQAANLMVAFEMLKHAGILAAPPPGSASSWERRHPACFGSPRSATPAAQPLREGNVASKRCQGTEFSVASLAKSNALRSVDTRGTSEECSERSTYQQDWQASSLHWRNSLTLEALKTGLTEVYWPGRFQVIDSHRLILDGAHNLAAAQALRSTLDERYPDETFRFVFACYGNKDGVSMLHALLKPGDSLYVSEAASKRATFSKEALAESVKNLAVQVNTYETIGQALAEAGSERQTSQHIVATGSFATIKEVVTKFGWTTVEEGC